MHLGMLKRWLQGLIGQAQPTKQPEPNKYTLVPPEFERDIRDRDRFVHSSYAYAFAKRPLKFLFEDYLTSGTQAGGGAQSVIPTGVVLFSPPTDSDNKLSVAASVAPGDASMNVRYQPLGLANPATFIDVNVTPQAVDKASFRGSFFDPELGVGAFVTAPLAKQLSKTRAQVGVRYSSPSFSTGLVVEPALERLSALWLVGRYQGIVAGMHLEPDASGLNACLSSMQAWRERAHMAIAYEPNFSNATGAGQFSASVEMQQGRSLLVSFYQHMALVRQVLNPLEDHKNVVGITNYLDIGIQIAIPTVEQDSTGSTGSSAYGTLKPAAATQPPVYNGNGMINVAAAWQLNKNWLIKARVSDASVSLGAAVKSWGKLGVVASANVSYRYADAGGVRYGAHFQLENFGARRYERGVSEAAGRAVLQRHQATEVDIANMEGTGPTVRKEATQQDYNEVVVDKTANYL